MKIAVIGGNGFIGQEFIKYAESYNHSVTIIEANIDAFSKDGQEQIISILNDNEGMLFLAAKRSTSEFGIDDYIYNIRLAGTYFDLARKANLKNIALASSRSVYSSEDMLPWKESLFDTPLSLYGSGKLAVDSLALHYNEVYGMKIKCLRLAQVIGMGERKGYLLNTLINNAASKKEQVIYGEGVGRRQYIYVKDVCDSFLHALTSKMEVAGIFNIGIEGNISVLQLSELINRVFDNDKETILLKDKPENKDNDLMDINHTKNVLDWEAKYDLVTTFKDICKDIKEQGFGKKNIK